MYEPELPPKDGSTFRQGLVPLEKAMKRQNRKALHLLLFLVTVLTTAYAGVGFVVEPTSGVVSLDQFLSHFGSGLVFSSLLLLFLTAHEFGHYFAARYYGVDVTLPYYIPMPLFFFGTMGAVIRIRSQVPSRKAMFDIGVAGPLAGFVVALVYIVIGMLIGPEKDYLYSIHPQYEFLHSLPDGGVHFGSFLLFDAFRYLLIPDGAFFPGMNEIYHYPLLCVGWFGMFVTALNMLPVGQLDGGHVIYGMFGSRQKTISRWIVRGLVVIGVGGAFGLLLEMLRTGWYGGSFVFLNSIFRTPLEWIDQHASILLRGWPGWLFWVLLIKFFVRVEHPPVPDETPLDKRRMKIGWLALGIFVLTFSWTGIYERTPFSPGEAPEMTMPAEEDNLIIRNMPEDVPVTSDVEL